MPLPVSATASRTTGVNSNSITTRLKQPIDLNKSHKHNPGEIPKKLQESRVEALEPLATSTEIHTNKSQSSSRIPSPFKRNTSNTLANSQQANIGQQKPTNKGHSRQQSAILPPLSARQKLGHTRSLSAVSVNTTSTSSTDTSRPHLRSNLTSSQVSPKSATPRLIPERTISTKVSSTRAGAVQIASDAAQHELLQLSIVHKDSARGVDAYQRSTAASLAAKHATLSSIRAGVQEQKQTFSTTLNSCAVDTWLRTEGYQKTCQAIQDLSVAVRDLYTLERIFDGDDGVAAAFEHWQQRITTIDSCNSTKEVDDSMSLHLLFEDRLSPELQQLVQQLSSSLATLANLPQCPEESSLFSTMQSYLSMAKKLKSQCQLMLQIGEHLVAGHVKWLQEEVTSALNDLEKSEHDDVLGDVSTWES